MDFAESAEHRALRAAVAEIAQDYGPRYYARHHSLRYGYYGAFHHYGYRERVLRRYY